MCVRHLDTDWLSDVTSQPGNWSYMKFKHLNQLLLKDFFLILSTCFQKTEQFDRWVTLKTKGSMYEFIFEPIISENTNIFLKRERDMNERLSCEFMSALQVIRF